MKSYKGFDKDLKCRGFQYEIGGEYEEDEAIACGKGFHACENPLDVFNYYPPNESRYCEVEQSGQISKEDCDTKVASTKIKIIKEIGIKELVSASFEYVKEHCTNSEIGQDCSALIGGDKSALTGSCYSALTGGDYSALTGGNKSALTGGCYSALTGGDKSALTGGYKSALTGGYKSAVAGGDKSAVAGGYCSAVTGGYKSAVAGGDKSAVAGGYCSAVTGGYKSAVAGGDKSVLTGDDYSAVAGGAFSVVYGHGVDAKVKGGIGSILVLAEYDDAHYFVKNHCETVDDVKIKADTFYTLENGKFTEVEE